MSEYKENVYVFFESYDKFNNIIKDLPGPWYCCDIGAMATFRDGKIRKVSVGSFKLAKWWKENKTNGATVFYQASDGVKRLIFNEEKIAKEFTEWFKTQELKGFEDYKLWESPHLLLRTMENDEELHIEAKVEVKKLFSYYEDYILTEEIFDIYCWVVDNLETVYYEDYVLYFKRKKDAVAFKVKWIE